MCARKMRPDAKQNESATLQTIADTVRRIMRSDTASAAEFSLSDKTVRWRATSGFLTRRGDASEIVVPLEGNFIESLLAAERLKIIKGIGVRDEFPARDFPVHAPEGVRDVAFVPLKVRGETLGSLIVGYRAAHYFTSEEETLLSGLSEMAALALDHARLFETVEAAKKIWEQTFDAIPDGIIVHDHNMRIVRCNAPR